MNRLCTVTATSDARRPLQIKAVLRSAALRLALNKSENAEHINAAYRIAPGSPMEIAASRNALCGFSLLIWGALRARSGDLKARNSLLKASGPDPISAKRGTIFNASRHSRMRPAPVNRSSTNERARDATSREAGL